MKKYVVIILIFLIVFILNIYYIKTSKNVYTSSKKLTDFELIFLEENSLGKQKIISKNIFDKESYDIFSYNGKVEVVIDNKKYDLKEALKSNKISAQDIVDKAKKWNNGYSEWDDGGSAIYHFENFEILKYNTLSGNKDLYIGSNDLNYSIEEK